MRIHTGLIRYSGTQDIFRIFTAVLTSSLIYGAVVAIVVGPMFHLQSVNIFVVLLVNFFISSSLLIMLRIGAKGLFYYIKRSTSGERENVMIYGSNGYSLLVKQALETSGMGKYVIAGFIDDNPNKVDKTIQQVRVYRGKDIKKLNKAIHIDKLFVLSEDLKTDDKKKVIEKCVELGIKVLTVPPTAELLPSG
jgi:FlaA1/EpsC-like NDP-sugar epimerase